MCLKKVKDLDMINAQLKLDLFIIQLLADRPLPRYGIFLIIAYVIGISFW